MTSVDPRVRYTLGSSWILRAPLRNCPHTALDALKLRNTSPRCVDDSNSLKASGVPAQATHKKAEDPGRFIVYYYSDIPLFALVSAKDTDGLRYRRSFRWCQLPNVA